jgi:hypothetical protein
MAQYTLKELTKKYGEDKAGDFTVVGICPECAAPKPTQAKLTEEWLEFKCSKCGVEITMKATEVSAFVSAGKFAHTLVKFLGTTRQLGSEPFEWLDSIRVS